MRVSDILYGVNVRKKAKEESCGNEKCAQEETVEIESVNKNQNKKQAGVSTRRQLRNKVKSRKRIQIKKLLQISDKHNV